MSGSEQAGTDAEAETGTDPETKDYEVLSGDVDGKGPGETVELQPHLAEHFDVMPADADRSSAAVRSQLIESGRGMTTLADTAEAIEAGEYEVFQDAIHTGDGAVKPGDTAHFEEATARAFADNLLAPGENGDGNGNGNGDGNTSRAQEQAQSEGVMMDDLNSPNSEAASEMPTEADADRGASGGAGGVTSYESPDEFLAETDTIANLETELDGADLSDDQLGKLLEAEQAGEDRTGAKDAIRDRMSGDDDDSANGNE